MTTSPDPDWIEHQLAKQQPRAWTFSAAGLLESERVATPHRTEDRIVHRHSWVSLVVACCIGIAIGTVTTALVLQRTASRVAKSPGEEASKILRQLSAVDTADSGDSAPESVMETVSVPAPITNFTKAETIVRNGITLSINDHVDTLQSSRSIQQRSGGSRHADSFASAVTPQVSNESMDQNVTSRLQLMATVLQQQL